MMTAANTEKTTAGAPQRRVIEDLPLPDKELDWGDDGTPLDSPSVVYLYRLIGDPAKGWDRINTREQLLDMQAAPDRYEVWTLFAIPVDELSRKPVTLVALAAKRLDEINAARRAAMASVRTFLREAGEQP